MTEDRKEAPAAVPDGVWESSKPEKGKNINEGSLTTDLQGNGYPVKRQDKK